MQIRHDQQMLVWPNQHASRVKQQPLTSEMEGSLGHGGERQQSFEAENNVGCV
jgi:hypothetical protein